MTNTKCNNCGESTNEQDLLNGICEDCYDALKASDDSGQGRHVEPLFSIIGDDEGISVNFQAFPKNDRESAARYMAAFYHAFIIIKRQESLLEEIMDGLPADASRFIYRMAEMLMEGGEVVPKSKSN